MAQFQLEVGTAYTTLGIDPPAVELARCQRRARYFSAASGNRFFFMSGVMSTTTITYALIPFSPGGSDPNAFPSMPAMTITGSNTLGDVLAYTNNTHYAVTAITIYAGTFYGTVVSATAGYGALFELYNAGAASWILFSCDL